MPGLPKDKVITVRLSGPAERRLRARAKALGVTPSALIRALLDAELGPDASGSLLDRTSAFVGAIDDRTIAPGRDARASLAEWDPDRR